MNSFMDSFIQMRLVYTVFTLYMLMVLLKWTSPVLGIDEEKGIWALNAKCTAPAIKLMKQFIPSVGPFDFAPLAVVLVLWLLRTIFLQGFSTAA
jgi:uncharacterized protein YggT (Ycf19 family)